MGHLKQNLQYAGLAAYKAKKGLPKTRAVELGMGGDIAAVLDKEIKMVDRAGDGLSPTSPTVMGGGTGVTRLGKDL